MLQCVAVCCRVLQGVDASDQCTICYDMCFEIVKIDNTQIALNEEAGRAL